MLVIVYLLTFRRGGLFSHGFMATADSLLPETRLSGPSGCYPIVTAKAIARVVQQVPRFHTKNPECRFEQSVKLPRRRNSCRFEFDNRVTYLADIGMMRRSLACLGGDRNYSLLWALGAILGVSVTCNFGRHQ